MRTCGSLCDDFIVWTESKAFRIFPEKGLCKTRALSEGVCGGVQNDKNRQGGQGYPWGRRRRDGGHAPERGQRDCADFLYRAVLILDEPTSAVDALAERKINSIILDALKDTRRTLVFISHRLSTTKLVDRILVFEDGRIVEEGNHRELMEKKGLYSKLYHEQSNLYKGQGIWKKMSQRAVSMRCFWRNMMGSSKKNRQLRNLTERKSPGYLCFKRCSATRSALTFWYRFVCALPFWYLRICLFRPLWSQSMPVHKFSYNWMAWRKPSRSFWKTADWQKESEI